MNFLFQERQAFVRTQTHTMVRDTDPDFRYFCSTQDGVVASLVRIWLTEKSRAGNVPVAYLGCVRFCRSLHPSIREIRNIVKRLEKCAREEKRDTESLRRELLSHLRRYVAKLKAEEAGGSC
jgi:hypothetical protein